MPTQAGRNLRYSDEAVSKHWITPRTVRQLASTIAPHVPPRARQSILDIKVYAATHRPTRQSLRNEPRFKKSASGLGLFCARSGVIQPSTGLVNRLHTTADRDLLAPESRYSAAELGLEPEQWRWLCVPGTANPFTGYGALVRNGGLRRDSAVDVSAKSPDPEAADLCDTLPAPYPDRWPRWVPPDRSVTLTCPGCACELTGVEDHRGGVMGYGCLVSPFGEGRYEEEDSEQGSSGGSGGVISVGGSVGGFSGEGPVFVRPSLLHHYWDEVETNEQGNKVDMEEGYLEDSEAGMEEGCVLVTE